MLQQKEKGEKGPKLVKQVSDPYKYQWEQNVLDTTIMSTGKVQTWYHLKLYLANKWFLTVSFFTWVKVLYFEQALKIESSNGKK